MINEIEIAEINETQQAEQLRLAVLHFDSIIDPRVERRKQHALIDIIAITLSAVISGADSFYEIETFAKTKRKWLKQFLTLENGTPSHDTFNRVISLLDPVQFQSCALDWIRAVVGKLSAEDVLAIDGKQLCGSASEGVRAVHMLNVWSHEHGLCLTSSAVDGKTNEITQLPGILDTLSLLDLAGCIVTVDALNTQRDIAIKIIDIDNDAHYLMALKANQGSLLEDVTWLFDNTSSEQLDSFETFERNRGRDESRHCAVLSDLDYLEEHAWPGLETVVKLSSKRTLKGKTSLETRYYLCSFKAQAETLLSNIRAHWGVENKLHWTLDVVFGEDKHDYAHQRGVENMAVLRQFALNLLSRDTSKGSLKGKRKQAAWDDDFRAHILLALMTG